MYSRALFALIFTTWIVAATPAQDQKVEAKEVTFNSADGVELQGLLYKSLKTPGDSACVILIHSFGVDPNKGDWAGLAQKLAKEGFNCLRFDLRGHGKSTVIDPKLFWADPTNVKAFPSLAKKKPLPNKIELKDIQGAKPGYFPQLANDILAARIDLDKRNDGGEVNTGSVYLIGSTDAATIGMLYMAAEWTRPQVLPQAWNLANLPPTQQVPPNSDMAGKDTAGAIWLTPTRHQSVEADAMRKWVTMLTDLREKNPVLCITGDGDDAGKKASKFIRDEVLVAKPKDKKLNELRFTDIREVKGTKNTGVNLLGNNLETEDTIVNYLKTLEKDRKNVTRTANRNYTKPPMILMNPFGIR
jgi:pimeloyl-ACP methyl ester carboxylesterase